MSNITSIALTPAQVATVHTLRDIATAKSVFLAGFTIVLYDYFIKLPDEVTQLWKRTNIVSRIVLCLRYYTLFATATICFGYFSPFITGDRCQHWMYFIPFGLVVPLMYISGTLMALRLYAIYDRSKIVLFILLGLLISQVCVGLWIWTTPGAHPTLDPINNYRYHYCIFIPAAKLGPHNPSVYAFMELSFDTFCFMLTLIRPFLGSYSRGRWGLPLWANLAQNGALYFGVIFSINLAWAIMILHASSGLRGAVAAPSAMMMSTFIARITLSLRSSVYGVEDEISRTTPLSTDRNVTGESHRLAMLRKRPGDEFTTFGELSYDDNVSKGIRVEQQITISNV